MLFDARGERGTDALHGGEFLHACVHDLVDIAERAHERRPLLLADPFDVVQNGLQIALAVQAAEIGDRKAVRLVADALQRL